ncbi:hypothetical protein NQ176_g6500 [Zarea fungicola]|uniref:Uncharacterized protein n=1 Tax=Zarea fungicola TaxID=93591 RepID=A0ACC1N438_9HYPO|nr:hypothetical protein NQ176_g6500 [Lecanicillium fungicola]
MAIDADIEAAISSLREAASRSDEARSATLDALRSLQLQIERPPDVWDRFVFMNLELTAARIGQDLGIYETLANSKQAVTVADFAAKSGASTLLIRKLAPGKREMCS